MTKTGAYPQYLPAPKSKPEQGAVKLKVDRMGMISTASGAAGFSQGPIPRTSTPKPQETARERSLSKERVVEGLRAYQLPKRIPTFHLDPENRDAQELVMVAPSEEVFMVDSDDEQKAQASRALDAS